jgi:hypothetical protein
LYYEEARFKSVLATGHIVYNIRIGNIQPKNFICEVTAQVIERRDKEHDNMELSNMNPYKWFIEPLIDKTRNHSEDTGQYQNIGSELGRYDEEVEQDIPVRGIQSSLVQE